MEYPCHGMRALPSVNDGPGLVLPLDRAVLPAKEVNMTCPALPIINVSFNWLDISFT